VVNLYSGDDYFRWDGRYSDWSRQLGASDLKRWLRKHQVRSFDPIFAHSHGGNRIDYGLQGDQGKAASANERSCEKPPTKEWDSIFANAGRIISLRSRFDLVICADRSPQHFNAQIRQLLPPGLWFSHGALLRPKVWERRRHPNEVSYERGLSQIP
jgi:hypothetical protein